MRGGFGHLRRFKLGALGLFRAAREKPRRGRYSPSGGINRRASGFYHPTAKTARRGFPPARPAVKTAPDVGKTTRREKPLARGISRRGHGQNHKACGKNRRAVKTAGGAGFPVVWRQKSPEAVVATGRGLSWRSSGENRGGARYKPRRGGKTRLFGRRCHSTRSINRLGMVKTAVAVDTHALLSTVQLLYEYSNYSI